MKGNKIFLKRAFFAAPLLIGAISVMAAHQDPDLTTSTSLSPYRVPSGYTPDPAFDPCSVSLAFSGCLNLRKELRKIQQALVSEQKTVNQFRALMTIKNEQSLLYVATLDELNVVRKKLAECNVSN